MYFNRTFAAGRTTGFTTHTTETNANEEVIRSPGTGHTEWSGTSANTYYFKNAWKVGDRTNASNPAEDR